MNKFKRTAKKLGDEATILVSLGVLIFLSWVGLRTLLEGANEFLVFIGAIIAIWAFTWPVLQRLLQE